MALMTHLRIRPSEQGADVRDAHRFMEKKMREHRHDHGRWPTVEELLSMAVQGSGAGEWSPRNGSEQFRSDPTGYFRGYILSALRTERHVFEYDIDGGS